MGTLKRAREAVFYLVLLFLVAIADVVARDTGDEKLQITYDRALGDDPTSFEQMLTLYIALRSFSSFPIEHLRRLIKGLEGNQLAVSAIQFAVKYRLDMRPPSDRRLLQRICDAADLNLTKLLLERQQSE